MASKLDIADTTASTTIINAKLILGYWQELLVGISIVTWDNQAFLCPY
jgi:hypothetical protein